MGGLLGWWDGGVLREEKRDGEGVLWEYEMEIKVEMGRYRDVVFL